MDRTLLLHLSAVQLTALYSKIFDSMLAAADEQNSSEYVTKLEEELVLARLALLHSV